MYEVADKMTEPGAGSAGTASDECHYCIRSGHAWYSQFNFKVFDTVALKTADLLTASKGLCCKNSKLTADCTGALTGADPGTL